MRFSASIAVFVLFYSSAGAQSLQQNMPNTVDQMKTARRTYDSCFFNSVGDEWKHGVTDPSMAAEMAFQACATEEQVMRAILASAFTQPQTANLAVLRVKTDLKAAVRKMAAGAARKAK